MLKMKAYALVGEESKVILFGVIIFILICIIVFQYKKDKERNKSINYIKDKINQILKDKTEDKVLAFSDDNEIKELLIAVNKLLEFNQKSVAEYKKVEISMKKMLSNISHDLKTPLTVVLGYIETINLDIDMSDEEKKVLLSRVHNKTLEIIELINKFFDLSKLEAGDKDIPITRVNMNEVCRENLLNFYEALTKEGIDVNIDIPEKDIYALGNEEALERILNNLISNSIKYGSDGKVFGISLRSDEEYAYVDIWDNGKGIDETAINKVFERMYTLEDSRNKAYTGSGLGLTITKRLVEKLGGEISLTSIPNEKTTFTFKLKIITY